MPIAAKQLSYTYLPGSPFEQPALKTLDLTVEDGEYIGVIGHTGSGKTTLIKLLCGLLKPTKGTVLLDGEDIFVKGFDKKKIRRKVGVVFQYPEYQLFEESVYKDIAFGPSKLGWGKEEIDKNIRRACELLKLDIDALGPRSPFELSGGQKRKVAIAGVIAMAPSVLILDEPVAGLDPGGRENLFEFVEELNRAGTTIVLITHSMDDLACHARRVIALKEGELIMDGPPREVFLNAGELKSMGLDVPEVAKIAQALRERGIDAPAGMITVDELTAFVRKAAAHA